MMKKKNFVLFTLALVVCAACALAEPSPESVKAEMKRVADWQIEHLRDDIGRYHEADNRLDAWTFGALYVGMEKWAAMAETDAYYTFLKGVGDELNWKLNAKYHADWIIVGQMYLDMYRKYGDPKMLTGIQQRLEWIKAQS